MFEGLFSRSYHSLSCVHSSGRFAAGSILKITYGHTVKSIDDVYVRMAEQAITATAEAGSPGSMLVDLFPPRKFNIIHPYIRILYDLCSEIFANLVTGDGF